MSAATTYSIPATVPRAARLRRKQWAVVLLALATLYVGSYVVLSYFGGYELVASGELRLFGGISLDDEFAWQPRWGFADRMLSIDGSNSTSCDLVGFFYMPLILLDQKLAHPTLRFVTPDGFHDDLWARGTRESRRS